MPPEELYPTKDLRYKICDFLIKRRVERPTLGDLFEIKFQEMEDLLQYAAVDRGDRVLRLKALRKELSVLNLEPSIEDPENTVINIYNLPTEDDFIQAYNENQLLKVQYTSESLDNYELKLKERTLVVNRRLGIVEFKILPSGGVKIILGEKRMTVGRAKGERINLRSQIIQIVHEEEFIYLCDLLDKLYTDEDIYEDMSEDDRLRITKSITDAVIGLNERSNQKFNKPIIENINMGLKWIL